MPDHESTRGDDPSLIPPPGTEANLDEQASASRRFPRFNLAALSASLPRFGRKKAAADAGAGAAEPAAEGYEVGPEPDTTARRFPKIPWHRLPLANARRETRVGAAALASFLILVSALVLNRVTRKDEKADEPAAAGTLLALNGSDEGDKPKVPETPKEPKARGNDEAAPAPKDPPERPSTRRPEPARTKPPEDVTPPAPTLPTPPAESHPAPSGPSTNEVAVVPPAKPRPEPTPSKPPEDPIARPQPVAASPKAAAPPPNPLSGSPAPASPAPGPAAASDDLPAMPPTSPPVEGPAIELPSFAPTVPDPKPDASKIAPKPAEPVIEPLPAPGGGPAAPLDPFPTNDPLPAPAPEPTARPSSPAPRPRTDPAPVPLPEPGPVEPKVTAPPPTVRPEAPTPAPAIAPEPTPAAKLPAFTKPPIESEPAPSPADAAAALPPGGRLVRNLGKKRMTDPEPQARLAPERSVPDAPLPREEVGSRDREDPILHVVESGENFWTISRTYYGSGRYYQALHAANRRQVPKVDELYVGTTIKVPPVEALDPALIDPPSRSADDAATRASRSSASAPVRSRSNDDGRSVPSRTRGEVARGLSSPRARDVDEPTRPTYRVRAHDTLRSIARDTLGDPHRYREILDLNRDAVDDGGRLITGVTLTLPEDAAVRDR